MLLFEEAETYYNRPMSFMYFEFCVEGGKSFICEYNLGKVR